MLVPPQIHTSGNFINYFSSRERLITFISASNFLKVSAFQIHFGINFPPGKLGYSALHLLRLAKRAPRSLRATRSHHATESDLASPGLTTAPPLSGAKFMGLTGCLISRWGTAPGDGCCVQGEGIPVSITRADGQ